MFGEIIERKDWKGVANWIIAMRVLGDRARAKFAVPKSYTQGRDTGLFIGSAISYLVTGYWLPALLCGAFYVYAIFHDHRRDWYRRK